ncbi:hypothetical protein ANO14919_088260 [Xylariales sp. No.14919]|nr:hypothetical protein ANO14919_088260 [Xylariales sp. No.14919]
MAGSGTGYQGDLVIRVSGHQGIRACGHIGGKFDVWTKRCETTLDARKGVNAIAILLFSDSAGCTRANDTEAFAN